ncbi:hypothetical protein MTO96_026096 [Rhipicephalus appendiculatus]
MCDQKKVRGGWKAFESAESERGVSEAESSRKRERAVGDNDAARSSSALRLVWKGCLQRETSVSAGGRDDRSDRVTATMARRRTLPDP